MDLPEGPGRPSNHRTAERVAAAAYGTVLVLGALVLLDPGDVASGWGWELLTGVGVATWLAHLYAEIVGDHVRHTTVPGRAEVARAMADGLPILLAAVPPALALLLGRLDVVAPQTALLAAVATGGVQLVGVGVFVGLVVASRERAALLLASLTAAVGAAVVVIEVGLGH